MKRLGFGMMRPPMQGEEIDRTVMNRMVDAFIAKGFTYFDTAPSYMNGGSERMVRDTVIRRYPRASVQIASKLPLWVAEEQGLSLEEIWQGSLERIEAGYFDYYLLHAMNEKLKAAADQRDAWGFVRAKREAGLIRHIGFSFHDTPEVLESILKEHPEMEFVQLQINYADWENPKVQARACYETARRYGKDVFVMEPVKGGTLANLSPEMEELLRAVRPEASTASWALRYAASLEGVAMVLSGMSTPEQTEDNLAVMENFQPLSQTERDTLERVLTMMRQAPQIACTGCRYCTEDCPQGIDIPRIFRIYNGYRTYGNPETARAQYVGAVREKGRASDCLQCGSCEAHCPQQLPIIEYLQQAAAALEQE